jgi:ABC-2 type transport system ATP-binding protein
MDLLRHIYRIPQARYTANLRQFTDLLDLDPFLMTPVRSLSLGQRMRAEIAGALLHDPELVFLDEPTIGLDVVAKERLRQFIRQINQERGTTIILTTHDLGDVEKLCERIVMIDHGRKLYDGPLADLRQQFGRERLLVVDFAEDYPDVRLNGMDAVRREGARAWYRYDRATLSTADLVAKVLARYRIQDLSVQEPEIEEIIRQIYEGGLLTQTDPPRDASPA